MRNQKELTTDLKLLARSSMVVFIGLALSKVIIYLYRIITARYFGPEVYGLFSLAMMISALFASFSAFGLSEGLLRYVSLYRGKKLINKVRSLVRRVTVIVTISSILFGFVLFLLADSIAIQIFHTSDLTLFLRIFAFAVPIGALANVLLLSLRAYEQIQWFSFLTNVFRNLAKLVLLIFFIFLGIRSNAVALSYVLGMAALLLASYLVMKYKIPELWERQQVSARERKKLMRTIVAYSLPLVFVGVIQSSTFWADSFFLGYYKSAKEVGLYAAALPIATLLSVIPELFMQLFFPLVTKHYAKKNLALVRELTEQISKWITIIALPLFILLVIFPETAITILFGREYLAAQNALQLLAGSIFFLVLSTLSYHLMLILGKSKLILLNAILTLLFSITANYFLIPLETIGPLNNATGLNGAAFAALLTSIFLCTLLFIETRLTLSFIPMRKKTLRVVFVALVPAFLLLFLKHKVPLSILTTVFFSMVFLVLYTVLLFKTNCLDKNDEYIFEIIKKKLRGLISTPLRQGVQLH